MGFVELVEHDDLLSSVVMRVRDDIYNTYYKVYIQKYTDAKLMTLRCGCPYNLGEICRHESAALFRLQDLIDKNLLGVAEIKYDQHHTIAKMKHIDLKIIKVLSSPSIYEQAETLLRTVKANIINAADERVEAQLSVNGQNFPLVLQKNDERNFDTSCSCEESHHPLSVHKTLLFLQLLNAYGPFYFDTIRNWDKEKDKLLQIYGYRLEDDLEGKFEFSYKEGKPFLKVLDPSIKRVAAVSTPARPLKPAMKTEAEMSATVSTEVEIATKKLGLVFNFNAKTYPGFTLDLVQGEPNEANTAYTGKSEALDLSKFINTEVLSEEDKQLLQQVRKLQDNEVNKYLNRNSPFSGIWENIIHTDGEDLPDETKALITEYLHPKLKKISG